MVRLNPLLYLICGLMDFAAFVVVFTVSRNLAEAGAETWYLGVVGAGMSFTAGVGSLLGGWLAHRFDGRGVFLLGAALSCLSIAACGLVDPMRTAFLPGYWLLGIGLGFVYPPLIGWLNQGEDPHANHRGVSRTFILYCISWNLGMMCGQLTAGSLFARGAEWTYGVAFAAAAANLILAIAAARLVVRSVGVTRDRVAGSVEAREVASAFKRLSWLANLGSMFGGSMVIHLLPGLAVAIGVHPDDHGKLLACWRAVIIATYLCLHVSTFWQYRLSTALVSQALAACGLALIARADSAEALLAGLALQGQLVGYNYFSGLFYSTAGSADDGRALAAGIHEATLAAGMAVGTIAGGILGSLVNHRMPYLLAATVMVVLMLAQTAAWLALRRGREALFSRR